MNISIIIPNFNGKDLLEKNLPYLLFAKQDKKNHIYEIILVDDASTDGSVKFLEDNFKGIKIVIHKKNAGFASSINSGAKIAKGDLICLLNNDVTVSKNFLETMDQNFKDEKVFGVSLHEKGFGYAKGKFLKGFIVHEGASESVKVKESFWASGGSSVFRRSVFKKLRGMDEVLLPFYWEDIDLSYRAQKRGYKILWDPKANVIHHHESSYGKLNQKYVQRIRERNQLLFIWKNLTNKDMFKKHQIELVKKILRHPGYIRIVLMAISKLGKLLELRSKEIKETTVSDETIFAKFN